MVNSLNAKTTQRRDVGSITTPLTSNTKGTRDMAHLILSSDDSNHKLDIDTAARRYVLWVIAWLNAPRFSEQQRIAFRHQVELVNKYELTPELVDPYREHYNQQFSVMARLP